MAAVTDTVETEGADTSDFADPFNIQVEYSTNGNDGPPFTQADKDAIERAARRWEQVITEGFPDTLYKERVGIGPDYREVFIDDHRVKVYAGRLDNEFASGAGVTQPWEERPNSDVPFSGSIWLFARVSTIGAEQFYKVALHFSGAYTIQ